MRYIAQPYFSSPPSPAGQGPCVEIYSFPVNPGDSPVTTINPPATLGTQAFSLLGVTPTGTPAGGPNGVLDYQDPSSAEAYLFILFNYQTPDGTTVGVVCVYDQASLLSPPGSQTPTPIAMLSLPNGPAGMAIQPGTGNLYVATDCGGPSSGGGGNGGVYVFEKPASGWANAPSTFTSQFANFDDDNAVAYTCANLAFDLHGNLWMTSFGSNSGNASQPYTYLTCFTLPLNQQPPPFLLFVNDYGAPLTGAAGLPASYTAPASMYPLSGPEGMAFDPDGNLWVANNNDPREGDIAVNSVGSLLRLDANWLLGQLNNPAAAAQSGNGLSIPQAAANIYAWKGAMLGGLFFDGNMLYVNDEGNKIVYTCDTSQTGDLTALQQSFTTSNVPTCYPGNGTMAIFNATPASLLIRDYATDIGAEPEPALPTGDVAWESCDIGVSTDPNLITDAPLPTGPWSATDTSTPALETDGSITIQEDTPAYVYVKVANTGSVDSTGTEVLKLYWAKGSPSLDWPQPWDGSVFSGSTPLGGFITATVLPMIPKQTQTYVKVTWSQVPIPGDYSTDVNHFCLLARIESSPLYPFGMWQPEQTGNLTTQAPLISNVTANSAIGWRNVSIFTQAGALPPPTPPGPKIKLGILGANYGPIEKQFAFAVQTLGRGGKLEPIKAKVVVHAEGTALERLRESRFERKRVSYLGEGRFHLLDLEKGLANVRLKPRETLPFTVEFTPEEGVRDFAVRVIQYLDVDGTAKVIGGQTFVVGKVEGFPVREKRAVADDEPGRRAAGLS
jgi:hypothetical protein